MFLIIFSIDISSIGGALFSKVSIIREEVFSKKSVISYTWDMMGGGLGCLFFTVFLVPLAGILNSLLILAAVNFLVLLTLLFKR